MGALASLRIGASVLVEPAWPPPAGRPTRLVVPGATLALGYHNRPAAEAESSRAGTFCPADLFVREFDGSWRFAGRDGSLIKLRGRWVELAQLEERLGFLVAVGFAPSPRLSSVRPRQNPMRWT